MATPELSADILQPLSADNDLDLQRHILGVMRLMRPHRVRGYGMRRFGSPNDGGYVHIDDFQGIDTAFSFGIFDNVSWDLEVADRGLTVHQFDHTVDAPVDNDPRLIFNRTRIATTTSGETESIPALLARHDKGRERPNILLKMDIENDEWPVFDALPPAAFGRFSQIVCEMHAFENFHDLGWRQRTARVLKKITDSHALVHVHANNYAGTTHRANVFLPNVLEVTFANRALYDLEPSDEVFPTALDAPCNRDVPDIYLGSFRF